MKVLFVGEGPHDIGAPSSNPNQPRPARGVIPTLARRVSAGIAPESIALAWREISRFNASVQRRGYSAKVAAAALLAVRMFDCGATAVVADRDREAGRQMELEEGVNRAQQLFPRHPAVWGLAVESVEAWTLARRTRLPRNSAWMSTRSETSTRAARMLSPCPSEAARRSIAPSGSWSGSRN